MAEGSAARIAATLAGNTAISRNAPCRSVHAVGTSCPSRTEPGSRRGGASADRRWVRPVPLCMVIHTCLIDDVEGVTGRSGSVALGRSERDGPGHDGRLMSRKAKPGSAYPALRSPHRRRACVVLGGPARAGGPVPSGKIAFGAWCVRRLWMDGNTLCDDDEGLGNGTSGHRTVAF